MLCETDDSCTLDFYAHLFCVKHCGWRSFAGLSMLIPKLHSSVSCEALYTANMPAHAHLDCTCYVKSLDMKGS